MEYCVICETEGVQTEATTHIHIFGDNVPVCNAHALVHAEDIEMYEED